MNGPSISSGDLPPRKKRLLYQAWHRGMKEMDIIMGHFADTHLATLDDADTDEFERLLNEQDRDLLSWILGEIVVPAHVETPFFARIRAFDIARRLGA
jgi:antitoxin CptB